jgi:hypothetical protein
MYEESWMWERVDAMFRGWTRRLTVEAAFLGWGSYVSGIASESGRSACPGETAVIKSMATTKMAALA